MIGQLIYRSLIQWRSGLEPARFGQGIEQTRDRTTLPITDQSPNDDRIGEVPRQRRGAAWNYEAQAYIGGTTTPASKILKAAGERAINRFVAEGVTGDVLQNFVRLPNGNAVQGNKIIKGEAANAIIQAQKERVERSGRSTSQFDTGGGVDLVFMETASETDRAIIFQAAMQELERLSQQPDQCTPEALANLAYLLFQSPHNKKGSDAVIRTFLIVAGTYLTGEAPVLRQDVDLRAGTMAQDNFVQHATQ